MRFTADIQRAGVSPDAGNRVIQLRALEKLSGSLAANHEHGSIGQQRCGMKIASDVQRAGVTPVLRLRVVQFRSRGRTEGRTTRDKDLPVRQQRGGMRFPELFHWLY